MEKSPEAFRTIREVADAMALPQHVLRFWETRFPQIRPLKRAGGRRYYRPDDVERLRLIKRLLYDEGYTIKGVQKLFKEQGVQALTNGSFDARPVLEAGGAELPLTAERDAVVPAFEAAALDGSPHTPSALRRGGSQGPALSADELAALRDSLEHIRQAERILARARSGEA
jgi:DNA-binding transcriptional MerR regulator